LDALKFGIAFYRGARPTIEAVQGALENDVPFYGVRNIFENGTEHQRNILNYIRTVFEAGGFEW